MPLFVLELTTATSCLLAFSKVRLSPIQSVLNAAASLIACLPKFSHISSCFDQLRWLSLSPRIEFKIVALVLKSKQGVAPKYLRDHICSPLSATSHRPLRSLDRQIVLYVPRVRTTIAQTRSFATIGQSLWNALPSSLRLTLLSGSLLASLFLFITAYFYYWGLRTGSATEWSRPRAALYKYYTI